MKKIKKGDDINQKCYQCGHVYMTVYRIDRSPGSQMFWCKCPDCGAVNDIITSDDPETGMPMPEIFKKDS